jgi:hypothetical protein
MWQTQRIQHIEILQGQQWENCIGPKMVIYKLQDNARIVAT